VPDQLDADVAHALGVGFATFVGADQVVIARDMRPSGPALVEAFSRGVMEQGVDVVDIGLASTDLMYYAAGVLDIPGAMFTASHNPAGYNGIKLCLAGARPIGVDTGLADVQRSRPAGARPHGPRPGRHVRHAAPSATC
jgi:phosphomannomutase